MTTRGSCQQQTISFSGRGVTSRQDISVEITRSEPGSGIVFEISHDGTFVPIPAHADFVVHTLRNVALGAGNARLCIVEHFLAAASLFGLTDLLVKVDGPEMPLGDGSAAFWIDLFASAGWRQCTIAPCIKLTEPIVVSNQDKVVLAIPDDRFSVSYHMDWDHPAIGKIWQVWDTTMDISELSHARTFGTISEHKLLGLENEVVSLTTSGFSQPLRFPDEPVRHKLLDLVGDLTLSGVNPMAFAAKFVSIKAGHELDVGLARRLSQAVRSSKL
ncbi:MAG: UDP-3-O-acyl-N-acetylglucosamine deacetylase [Candidatus Melainabacteria bacterium]|nr:UDP-3-O-acyl-N-acetylglucosamine deacetylase [Candidatus Melainabacteria bacterium]